jgi:hypothetical protein
MAEGYCSKPVIARRWYGVVRRQNIWEIWQRDRMEDLAHLLTDVMRLGRDAASVGFGWSAV